MNNDDLFKKGDVFGRRYEVLDLLGKGGFGVVYLVHDRHLKILVALKTFRDEFLADPKARDAFKKESLLWVSLENHPHILAAQLVNETNGRLFVSMDYIAPDAQGRVSLHDHLISTNGPLDANQALGWAIQFCLGMEHAQTHGIKCHRDIKPSNILITQDYTLKIADFGLAAAAAKAWDKSDSRCNSVETSEGAIGFAFSVTRTEGRMRCGTPGYMAPEVYRCESADLRSDIYSFGLVLWQMATGSRVPPFIVPYHGDIETYLLGVYRQQMAEKLQILQDPLGLIIERCLRAVPSERYRSFQELRGALESVWNQRTGTEYPIPQVEEKTADFWSNKGSALCALGQYDESIKCYDNALENNPHHKSAWNGKGIALNHLSRLEEAIECYDKVLEIDPGCADAWNNKGVILDALRRFREALICYNTVLVIDSQHVSIWVNKGNTLNTLRRHEEAIHCFDNELAINPRCTEAWSNKGVALGKLGLHENAIVCYDKALEIDPQFTSAWNNQAISFLALGQHEKAIGCLDKLLAINSQNAKAWSGKGYTLNKVRRYEEALYCLEKALEIDSRCANTWYNKGDALKELRQYDNAIDCYDKALAIDPRLAVAWYGKAQSKAATGYALDAIRTLRKFLKLVPPADPDNIATVRQWLRNLESKGI
ncbi:MAG: tetratricopeptide repeat protein [Verrucomicrobiota bacterium]